MSLKSYRLQYTVWLLMLAAFFVFDSMTSISAGDKQVIGSWSIRFLFEFTVLLGLFAWFSKSLKAWHLFPITAFTYFIIWREWIDEGFKWLVSFINGRFDLIIPVYPQMGLMITAGIAFTGLVTICLTKRRSAFRVFALTLLFLFSGFHGLAHWQTLTNLDQRTSLILDGYKKLSIQSVDQFQQICKNLNSVCFSGQYSEAAEGYRAVYRSKGDKDVPEHQYFTPGDFDGFAGINKYASNQATVSYTWSTNYLKFPTIDSPLKIVSYNKIDGNVYIIIDDISYLKTKQEVINLIKPFLFIFGVVWVLFGIGVFLMHGARRG